MGKEKGPLHTSVPTHKRRIRTCIYETLHLHRRKIHLTNKPLCSLRQCDEPFSIVTHSSISSDPSSSSTTRSTATMSTTIGSSKTSTSTSNVASFSNICFSLPENFHIHDFSEIASATNNFLFKRRLPFSTSSVRHCSLAARTSSSSSTGLAASLTFVPSSPPSSASSVSPVPHTTSTTLFPAPPSPPPSTTLASQSSPPGSPASKSPPTSPMAFTLVN